ncbi:enoyl-CoA hydratase/isomerase family protein [Nocardia beijingensis]|uniref:enoyl-CoA hydratase/isomerase family protein n=1 Tax=Nocardia beijingensis TaxID=95162 RepID=UPI00189567EB|nr:enoyl-CoA hydratase/isomerase family protein [Nocardia beijingensis]MBF6469993.1 enoyl-CoA hydratase/isomerase family protein [Nocardia beijingensis]
MNPWGVDSGYIDVTVRDNVGVVTFQRENKLNALTASMRKELAAILRHYGSGDSVRGIVITGSGRAFSAGQDMSEAAEGPDGLISAVELFHDVTRAALQTKIPVVAAVNGLAVGGACEMTLSFDARLGTRQAEYFLPENNLGLAISNAASILLRRLVGNKAMGLVLESTRIDAQSAFSLGLLDHMVEPGELVDASIALVQRWTQPGAATVAHLQLLRPSLSAIEAAIQRETTAARYLQDNGIAQDGIQRFLTRNNG